MSKQSPAVVVDGELIPCRVVVWLEASTDNEDQPQIGLESVDGLSAREVLGTLGMAVIGFAQSTGWPTREVMAGLVRVTHQLEQEGWVL